MFRLCNNIINRVPNYLIGVLWFILSLVVSNLNDALSKLLGSDLPPMEIAFFRFLFGMLSLVPLMLFYGRKSFVTSRPFIHFIRGTLLFVAISLWTLGIQIVPIVTVTMMSFTVPVFVLMMAPSILGEKVGWRLWFATILCMAGVVIILNPMSVEFNPLSLIFLISAFMFAALDVINKKYVIRETMLSMLFYSALVTTLLSIWPTMQMWVDPSLKEVILLFILGAGSNLILYFLLKAFMLANASSLAPYRYLELLISATVGWLFFAEIPESRIYLGAMIIIPTTLFVAYKQIHAENTKV